jgi:hypothetical protein
MAEYALQRPKMSEEAWLWHGWALYCKGDTAGAIEDCRKVLSIRPGYGDALQMPNFVDATP